MEVATVMYRRIKISFTSNLKKAQMNVAEKDRSGSEHYANTFRVLSANKYKIQRPYSTGHAREN